MSLLWILLAGALVGFAFDWYRIFRYWCGWGRILTVLGDFIFSLLALAILIVFLQKANSLSFRFYTFAGAVAGLLLYMRLASRIVTGLAMGLFRFLEMLGRFVIKAAKLGLNGLGWLIWPFYVIFRWFSLLFYRFAEVLFVETARSGRHKAEDWWNRHFPPRTNG